MNKKLINNIDSITSISIVRTIIIMVVLAVIVWLMFFRKTDAAEQSTEDKEGNKFIQDIKEDDTQAQLTDEEWRIVRKVADNLYNDMIGWHWSVRGVKYYNDYLVLSDKLFVAVNNYFNKVYAKGKEKGKYGNLRQWFRDESWNGMTQEIAATIQNRMDKLNLT